MFAKWFSLHYMVGAGDGLIDFRKISKFLIKKKSHRALYKGLQGYFPHFFLPSLILSSELSFFTYSHRYRCSSSLAIPQPFLSLHRALPYFRYGHLWRSNCLLVLEGEREWLGVLLETILHPSLRHSLEAKRRRGAHHATRFKWGIQQQRGAQSSSPVALPKPHPRSIVEAQPYPPNSWHPTVGRSNYRVSFCGWC